MNQTQQGLSEKALLLIAVPVLFGAIVSSAFGVFFLTIAAGLTHGVVREGNIELGWFLVGAGVLAFMSSLLLFSMWRKKRRARQIGERVEP